MGRLFARFVDRVNNAFFFRSPLLFAPSLAPSMFPVAVDPEESARELKNHLLSLGLFCLAVRLAPTVLAALGRA